MLRLILISFSLACLGACTSANFIVDAPPIQITEQTPEHFELPARIGLVRLVYGQASPAGAQEAALWADLAERAGAVGMLRPLLPVGAHYSLQTDKMIAAAREQRFDYLLVLSMQPRTASADISIIHVGSGGLMATAQAVADQRGQTGIWGYRITNASRLDRVTLGIAQAARPEIEALLQGMVERQH